ncbi:MAG: SDR family oxidoreductase [Elusimicrobia bacterium]|nr:SDR family oxidoreductase [Elusimicrobiota bacterium]
MKPLKKVVLITGSSRGIGFEAARQLARQGCAVLITARTSAKAQSAAKKLAREGRDVAWLEMDAANKASIRRAKAKVMKQYGHLDVLINNAAIYEDSTDSLLESAAETILKHFENNTLGPILVCQVFMPLILKSDDARIINVSSGYGSLAEMRARAPGYSISKAALNAATRQLAAFCEHKVSINSVCPGWVRTDMGGPNAPRSVEKGAETVVWLASDAPRELTGKFFRDKREIGW